VSDVFFVARNRLIVEGEQIISRSISGWPAEIGIPR